MGSLDSGADETGQTSTKGKGAHPCCPVPGASSTGGLSPSLFSSNLRVPSSPGSLAEPRAQRSRGESGAGPLAPPDCGHARLGKDAVPSPFLASCQMASVSRHSLGSILFHSCWAASVSFSSLSPPPQNTLKKIKNIVQLCLPAKRSLQPSRSDSQAFASRTLHAVVQIGTRFKTLVV